MTPDPGPPTDARRMTAEQYADAMRRRAWRAGAPPAAPAPPPLPPGHASRMTEPEYRESVRRRAWRAQ